VTCHVDTSAAILDGSDPATFTWANQGGTVYKTTITKQSPNVVLANGKRLFKHTSLTDLQSLAEESPGFFTTGTDLYVNLQGMGYVLYIDTRHSDAGSVKQILPMPTSK
jgi:hypothetical protein